ncbi:MAG: hypothetical protein A2033_19740 [Bacteroidetes bacterium GWA2_31_9]|nr:MAG: hypothetical protein A2033_19740 [Bacteroidetes bacterium GWA2_31_9]
MSKVSEDFVKKGASKISIDDVQKVLNKSDEIESKVNSSNVLKRLWEDIKLLFALIKAYISKKYTKVPWWVISAVAFSLLYLINPFDLIPDAIPVIGQLDDAAVIGICIKMIEKELLLFNEWKLANV